MIKIFIVEDDPAYSKLLEMVLQDDNYDISVFDNGKDFLNNLDQQPDIITLDYNLHELKGTDILKKVM